MMNDFFQRALGITLRWFIKTTNFDKNIKRLDIEVDFKRGTTFIDDTEDIGRHKQYSAYDTVDKTWQHLNFFNTHGCVSMIAPPWSGVVSFRLYSVI